MDYPTDETLERIRTWKWEETLGCLAYVRSCWKGENLVTVKRFEEITVFRFATGGWSGNEDMILALQTNHVIWSLTWKMSQSGGLHVFYVVED